MKFGFGSVWRSVAVSALLNAAMPVAEAWAAEEIQILRRAPGNVAVAMPFTTFQQEEMAIGQSLPCKWISKDGRVGPSYGSGRYDYLCKGGDFATINLYMDKTGGDGVGRVRLMYREWNAAVNPNAGEAKIALQYLQHVTGRFVPAAAAGQVMDTFWAQTNRKWTQDGVEITFDLEKGEQFNVRRLTLKAKDSGRSLGAVPVMGGGLAKPGVAPVPPVQVYIETPEGQKKPIPAVTPTDAGLSKQPMIPATTSVVLPTVPVGVLPTPGVGGVKTGVELIVPPTAPAGPQLEQPGKLEQATPAELNTAPAPETQVAPMAIGTPSSSLVPSGPDGATGNAVRAPSNFDVYNRAMELTKDVEAKAQIKKVEEAKVTASKPVATETAPSLAPVPTPGEGATSAAVTGGLGNGAPAVPAVQATPKPEEVGQPTNYQGPRRTEARPLPQLKFVPKAEPLRTPDDVIQFEDEKSRL
ncbi:MAG: hypothetical protein EON60_08535 [Alphaproteobacteria bacterium]|nr:MAG: hypothetical protein EON60_08535 [Alphaproteobacteria bacterium]